MGVSCQCFLGNRDRLGRRRVLATADLSTARNATASLLEQIRMLEDVERFIAGIPINRGARFDCISPSPDTGRTETAMTSKKLDLNAVERSENEHFGHTCVRSCSEKRPIRALRRRCLSARRSVCPELSVSV